MKWTLTKTDKETEHRFLNFYVMHFDVVKDDDSHRDYSYFLASRHENGLGLRAITQDFSRPDAVLVGCYQIRDGQIYLLLEKQFRPGLMHDVWSFPAGLADPEDASVEATAIREVREETGYGIEDIEVVLPPSPTSEGLSDECNAVCLAKLASKADTDREEFEDIADRLYSEEEVQALLQDKDVIFSNSARLLVLLTLSRFHAGQLK